MPKFKLNLGAFSIVTAGVMLSLPILSMGLFKYKMPNDEETAMYKDNLTKLEAEAAKQKQADQRVAQAVALIKAKDAEWTAIASTRTPPDSLAAGGINLSENGLQLAMDTPRFRNSIQSAVNRQIKRGGVKVINGPMIPTVDPTTPPDQLLASFYNYPALPFPVVIFDLGTVTVQGTYAQIMDNVRSYKTMPNYLAVADGLRLDGTSPVLTGTYNLSIVGFIRAKTIYPPVPTAGGIITVAAPAPPKPGVAAPKPAAPAAKPAPKPAAKSGAKPKVPAPRPGTARPGTPALPAGRPTGGRG